MTPREYAIQLAGGMCLLTFLMGVTMLMYVAMPYEQPIHSEWSKR